MIGSTNAPGIIPSSGGLANWLSGTTYAVGDCVIYEDRIYQCKTANSDTTWTASKWTLLSDKLTDWASGTSYKVGDCVIYDNRIYECLTANTDTVWTPAKWQKLSGGLLDWASGTAYIVGDTVIHNRKIYECITANTDTAWTAANWQALSVELTDWASGTSYIVSDCVIYNNCIYECVTANSDTTFTSSKWQVIGASGGGATISTWAASTSYAVGDLVIYNASIYQCLTANNDAAFDPSKWQMLGGKGSGLNEWATATSYAVGDYVVHGTATPQIYRCITAHTSTTWSADIANWELISGTSTWTPGETYTEGQIIYYDKTLYHVDVTQTAGSVFDDTDLTPIGGSGGGAKLANVEDAVATAAPSKVTLSWVDPPDVVISGATVAEWAGTRVVRKAGSPPLNKNDGDIVVDSVIRDQYSVTGFEDTTVENGTTYYYRWFPYTTSEAYTSGTTLSATPNLLDSEFSVLQKVVWVHDAGTTTARMTITATSLSSEPITVTVADTSVATAIASGMNVAFTFAGVGETTALIEQPATSEYTSGSQLITIKALHAVRYGYKIEKAEADPYARVTYTHDAVGMTPAAMDFTGGSFNYGSWQNLWFVSDNKPLMLKSDGTVDYYLNPNNYDYKEDGITPSDVSNTAYDGNAMAQFPLCWVYRYEDTDYCYEIVSNVQYDSNYKAYAHTRADGSIADYFYWSCFGGSGNATKIRSLAGQTLSQSLTAQQEITGATANGSKWYTYTWSQRELIRTLCVLLGKSTNTQAVFGNGNCRSATAASGLLTTGTLDAMGQFFGYNDSTHQVKVFHIEKFWGDQWDRTAGVINSGGKVYVKMTPEGSGYRISDVTGYTNTGVTLAGTSGGYINAATCSELGIIPVTISGSGTTYYADGAWFDNSQLDYLIAGAGAYAASTVGGAFAFAVNHAPSYAYWDVGCGLSCEQPAAA